ncbi:MAG: Glu-tRNA(Gln) amidotransferase subunit GatE [Thermoplasmata archaeon]
MDGIDYEELGLKVGLEIHQQLDTKKLFCRCPSEMVEDTGPELLRYLRPTASELGEVDRAALMEARKGLRFRYQCPRGSTCLVEMDEEPPQGPDLQAMELALKISKMVNAIVVDEVHFMRKIVIDGSNTTGFQRTGLVAMDGELIIDGKRIGISPICLEEDAGRKVESKGKEKTYRLDRLGIPLIELATGPDISSPEEAKYVAQYIGGLLRATRSVKRGIGTIREDVNISIAEGSRVEIKGVQELKMLPTYIENEVERQLMLIRTKELLNDREAAVLDKIYDLSDLFKECSSKIVKSALKRGKGIYGIKLKGFEGTLRGEDGKAMLGPELAAYARTAGVGGIFHSDELPAYGIDTRECEAVAVELDIKEDDAFALVVDEKELAKEALEQVCVRAQMAMEGVPEETRNAVEDGSTVFLRPISGRARMYPETDISPYPVSAKVLEELEIPETPEEMIQRFDDEYGLNRQQSSQLFRKGYDLLFEELMEEGIDASIASNTFLHIYPELLKEGYGPDDLSESVLKDVLTRVKSGEFAKEGISSVLMLVLEGNTVDEAVSKAGLEGVDEDDVRAVIREILKEREEFVRERGLGAMGPLMGVVMREFRGKVDGKKLSNILKDEIEKWCS